MKCYLHIGTEKTATTTVQKFLHLNRKKLSELGLGITRSVGLINNQQLATAAYDLDRRDNYTKSKKLFTDEDLLKFQNRTLKKLESELSKMSFPKIVFSSEFFQSRLRNISEIQRLKDILNNVGIFDITIIIYLRDPADLATSLYSTAIKGGAKAKKPASPNHPYYENLCNHKKTLENFGLVFGDAALVPRLFDKREFEGGDIIKDFIRVLNLPWLDEYTLPENMNESLSLIGLEILRRFNDEVPRFINDKENPLRDDIVKRVEHYFRQPKYVISNELRQEYNDEFQESNEWVRKKWFPQREMLFHRTETKELSSKKFQPEELDNITHFLADIWNSRKK